MDLFIYVFIFLNLKYLKNNNNKNFTRIHSYHRSQGWFWSCDQNCQTLKSKYLKEQSGYHKLLERDRNQMRDLKGKLGIFSKFGNL